MRKIEKEMMKAISGRKSVNLGNTSVVYIAEEERSEVFLFKNHIADFCHFERKVDVNVKTLSKWSTVTTRSRLRAMGVNVYAKKSVTHLDGEEI